MSIFLQQIHVDLYASTCGLTLAREYGKHQTTNLEGCWVLRDSSNNFIDYDQYRSDLVERNTLKIVW